MAKRRGLSQSEIVNRLAARSGIKKTAVKSVLNDLANMAAAEVRKKGEFTLPGIGKFVKSDRKARVGRNPATGEKIEIAAKTTVKFRAAKSIKTALGALPGDPGIDGDPN